MERRPENGSSETPFSLAVDAVGELCSSLHEAEKEGKIHKVVDADWEQAAENNRAFKPKILELRDGVKVADDVEARYGKQFRQVSHAFGPIDDPVAELLLADILVMRTVLPGLRVRNGYFNEANAITEILFGKGVETFSPEVRNASPKRIIKAVLDGRLSINPQQAASL